MRGIIYLLLTGTAVFWGANFNVGKMAIGVMDPMSVVAWRFIAAALIMVLILWIKERPALRSLRTNLIAFAILGAVGIFGFNAFLFVGLAHTSPANASLIMATNPLLTLLLSVIVLRDKISLHQAGGIALSLAGVLFVLSGGNLANLHGISSGDLFIFCGNLCWALYGVFSRKVIKGSTPLATSTMTMLAGALCFASFASFHHVPASPNVVIEAWLAIGFMALFGSVLAYLWWNRGIAQIGVNRTAIFFNLVPVSTLAITVLSGGRLLSAQLLGAVFVLAGVILASRKAKQPLPEIGVHKTAQ